MSAVAELDRTNVVDVDLGSAEFKANAHRLMAEWATRPPFYVLGKGRQPQVVVGRYADVHKVFSDTETFASEMPRGPGWEQFNKIMDAQFVTQMDGEQHARVRRLLMPAFSSRRIEQLQASITGIVDGMLDRDREERARVRRHEGPRRASRGRCFADRHGRDGPAAEGDLRRVPRPHSGHHLRQAGRAVVAGDCGAPSTAPWKRSRSSSTSGGQAAPRLHQRSRQRPRRRRQAHRQRAVRPDLRHLRRARCRRPAVPPAARSTCSTPTTTSASS